MNQRLITWACAALALLALAGQATADSHVAFAPGRLIVEAEGELLVPYDMIELTLEMTVQNKSGATGAATGAMSKHSALLQELSPMLSDLGIGLTNMTTEEHTIDSIYEYCDDYYTSDPDCEEGVVGYEVYSELTLDIAADKVDVLPKIYEAVASHNSIDELITMEVTYFDPYVSDELKAVLDEQLFAETFAEAETKAEMYASAAGRTLGSILVLSDSPIGTEADAEDDYYSDSYYDSYDSYSTDSSGAFASATGAFGSLSGDDVSASIGFQLGEGQKLWKTIFVEYELIQ